MKKIFFLIAFVCLWASPAHAAIAWVQDIAPNAPIDAADVQEIRTQIDIKRATVACGSQVAYGYPLGGPVVGGNPITAIQFNETKQLLVSSFVWTPAQTIAFLDVIPNLVADDIIQSTHLALLRAAVEQASCGACACGWVPDACGSCGGANDRLENWVCAPAACLPPPLPSPRCVLGVAACGGACGGCAVVGGCGGNGCPATHVPVDCPGCVPASDCQASCDCACPWISKGPCGNDGCPSSSQPRFRDAGCAAAWGCAPMDCHNDGSTCENCNSNGSCEDGIGEDCANCVADCGCGGALSCQSGECKDCFNVVNGGAVQGCDGVCNSGKSNGCDGVCGSGLSNDCAGVCGGGASTDCAGDCGGSAAVDCAGVCNGGATDDGCGCGNGPPACDYDGDGTPDCC